MPIFLGVLDVFKRSNGGFETLPEVSGYQAIRFPDLFERSSLISYREVRELRAKAERAAEAPTSIPVPSSRNAA